MSSPNLDPQVDTALLPEPFEVNTDVVDKATEAARAALEWMSTRFGQPARGATPPSQVEPRTTKAPGHEAAQP